MFFNNLITFNRFIVPKVQSRGLGTLDVHGISKPNPPPSAQVVDVQGMGIWWLFQRHASGGIIES